MKTPRDYFFEVIKKKGDIEIRSSITAQINEEDFIRVMEEYANLKVNAVLPQANVIKSVCDNNKCQCQDPTNFNRLICPICTPM